MKLKMDKIVNSFYIYIHASMLNVNSFAGERDGKKVFSLSQHKWGRSSMMSLKNRKPTKRL